MSGCATSTLTLYSDTRDKQGQDAQKAWAAVDLAGQLSIPRKNLKALLDEQLAVEDALWSAHRTARARELSYSWTLADFDRRVRARFAKLSGVTEEELQQRRNKLESTQESFQTIITNFSLVGQPPPKCDALLKEGGQAEALEEAKKLTTEAARIAVQQAIPRAVANCRTFDELQKLPTGGELGVARGQLKLEKEAIEQDEQKATALKAAFDDAQGKYTESTRALLGDPDDPKAKEDVSAAIKKLSDLVEKISKAQDAFSVKVLTEERLASLDGFLTTYQDIAAGKEVKDGNKVAIALAVFPDVREKARKALSDLQKPKLSALAIQKSVELAKLEAVQKDIGTRRQIVAELEGRVAALDAQLQSLASALAPFDKDSAIKTAAKKTLLEVMTEKGDAGFEMRTKLWGSTTRYLDAEGRLRAEAAKANYRISALSYERALTYSESSINQWKALIDPSVELMAMYGAAGLKSSDLIALFNSVTLLWIGAGVH